MDLYFGLRGTKSCGPTYLEVACVYYLPPVDIGVRLFDAFVGLEEGFDRVERSRSVDLAFFGIVFVVQYCGQ